jgi:hypothetical protein
MHIVGITGHAGAGKDEVAGRLAEKYGYLQIALADPIKRFGLNVFGFDVIQLWGPAKNTFDPLFNECNIRSSGVLFEPGCQLGSVKRVCDMGWGDAAVRLSSYGPKWIEELVPLEDREEALKKLYFWFASLGHHYPQLSPRICLQHLGTEWGRNVINKDIWISKFIDTAQHILDGYQYSREVGLTAGKEAQLPNGIVVSDVRFANEIEHIRKVGGKVIRVTRESADKKANSLGIMKHASEVEQAEFADNMFDCILKNDKTIKDLFSSVDIVAAAFKGNK